MHLQKLSYWCGPASVQNALAWLGTRRSQETIAVDAKTTAADGTDEFGIMAALRAAGHTFVEFQFRGPSEATNRLNVSLAAGRPWILCVDKWEHWITVVGRLGDRYTLLDPANTSRNLAVHGSLAVTARTLIPRWRKAFRETDLYEYPFYAIEVHPKEKK